MAVIPPGLDFSNLKVALPCDPWEAVLGPPAPAPPPLPAPTPADADADAGVALTLSTLDEEVAAPDAALPVGAGRRKPLTLSLAGIADAPATPEEAAAGGRGGTHLSFATTQPNGLAAHPSPRRVSGGGGLWPASSPRGSQGGHGHGLGPALSPPPTPGAGGAPPLSPPPQFAPLAAPEPPIWQAVGVGGRGGRIGVGVGVGITAFPPRLPDEGMRVYLGRVGLLNACTAGRLLQVFWMNSVTSIAWKWMHCAGDCVQ